MTNIWRRTRYSLYLGALDEAIICNLCAILFENLKKNLPKNTIFYKNLRNVVVEGWQQKYLIKFFSKALRKI